ncbi:CHRD domain-containing protein [Pontibaca salina]|uniref:CHRD domain-containing protein n=1 Tax=Pontibaca salina TaxID=2795731 RepID=A0A934HR14_9RHOB|nr:CHRD domain-containing protein [Pontibaca salina]MBI6629060.1 CHRD domain-containing protein [Pontibaca salina]
MFMPNIKQLAVAVSASAMLALPACAETTTYTADLTSRAEVPPNDSTATGTAEVTVDKNAGTVSWAVTTENLTGEPTAAHIHGPASPDENAPPDIDMSGALMNGSADITEAQIGELRDGKYYVNVHTEAHPDGEIRGQLDAAE